MAKAFDISLVGIKEVQKVIEGKSKELQKELDMELSAYALDVQKGAKRYAPIDTGKLRQGMSIDTTKKYFKTVGNTKEYAPYVEFGTGDSVSVPEGLEMYAMEFKGKDIRKVNLPARPFLFKTNREELPKLIERLKNLFS